MREIKFRAWDFEIMHANVQEDFSVSAMLRSGWIIEQYTGLKDRHGKEIYEGDILQLHGDPSLRFPVKWEDEAAGWAIECHNREPEFLGDYLPGYLEIIGNIRENPELVV